MQSRELALICSCSFSFIQLVLDQSREQLFRFNQRYLNVSVWVSFQEQLLLNCFRQNSEYCHGFSCQALFNEGILVLPCWQSIEFFCLGTSKQFIDFLDQCREFRNEFNNTFRNDCNTEVHAVSCTLFNRISDVISNLRKRHLLSCNFFRNQAYVWLCFQCTFKCYVRSGTAHNLDKMPVLLSGVSISFNVTDNFTVCLCSCIETERAFDVFILQVTIDCLRAADYLNTCVVSCEIFSQNCSVCIGVITTDDDDSCDAMLLADFCSYCKLVFAFKLCSAGTDNIESACVSVCIDVFIIEDQIVVIKKSAWTILETIQNVFLICSL